MKLITISMFILAFASLGGITSHGEIPPMHSPLHGLLMAVIYLTLMVGSAVIDRYIEKRKRAARQKARRSIPLK